MPLYHTMGIHSLLAMHLVGGCYVPQARWDPDEALELIERERITSLYLAPTLFHDLLGSDRLPEHDVSSVRALGYAGAAMTSSVVDALRRRLRAGGVREPLRLDRGLHVLDRRRPALEAGLRRPAGRSTRGCKLEPDGEICAHLAGDEAFAGYWNRPDADAKAIRDGWYHTGDTGHLDEDGDLWVDGRLDDMIISGGENIHPVEVEDVLASHPGVREVAVIGAADDRLGSRVVAVVVGDATPEELDAHCLASSLARFKRPREYRLVAALPKSASGKILRRVLRDESKESDVSEYDGFRVEHDAERGVATVTLDVPGKFNRVSMLARDQLAALFAELDRDDAVRFVVLTGAGGQFTAGGDIAGFLTKSPWVVSQLAKNVAAPERCSKPVIAKLEGYVFGVGMELALACDFRIAADDMQMALPEATIGMIPGSGGTQRLARLVGLGRAKDIVMRGRRIKAEEALAIGLVTEVVAAG